MKTDPPARTPNENFNRPQMTDPVFLADIRDQMLKFTRLHLHDESLVEDAVQEALMGAMKSEGSFDGRSALKTWVFAILKNKIADLLRKEQRLAGTNSFSRDNDDQEDINALFDTRGYWERDERPVSWSQPMDSVKTDHFWRVFEVCLDGLPATQAKLFMMREFLELESTEICEILDITTSNLHVMLYRARLRLRECLENRWFNGSKKS